MRVNPTVFFVSAGVIALFLLVTIVFGVRGEVDVLNEALGGVRDGITAYFGWFYVLAATGFLGFTIWLWFSRYGRIKLGKDDEQPEYNVVTWFAMLFSAGMGIGLLFFSVAEPMWHYFAPPPGAAEAGSVQAARDAMRWTYFHWGLHAWAIYIVVGISLAYFAYRHDLPLTIRSCLYPLLGQKIYGRYGDIIEIVAVFGTLFGVATSLGLGAMQISAGLDHVGFVSLDPDNPQAATFLQIGLIAVITAAATISVVTGLNVGIRRLSEMNLLLGVALILFVFLAGPTVLLMLAVVENTGNYVGNLLPMSFTTLAYQGEAGANWQSGWTMFYWGWWISWSPFVGMFIARISRGRTIRAFIGGVLLVPTLLTFVWLGVFGNAGLELEQNPAAFLGDDPLELRIAESPDDNPSHFTTYDETTGDRSVRPSETHLFVLLESMPAATLTIIIAMIVIATFFVTSSDSGSLVIDIITSGGHPEPPRWQRIFWAVTEGLVAALLLYVGGQAALYALQAAAIATALPFSIVMIFICIALVRGLRRELKDPSLQGMGYRVGRPNPPSVDEAKEKAVAVAHEPPNEEPEPDWQERLRHIAEARGGGEAADKDAGVHETLRTFIDSVVLPAFAAIGTELEKLGRSVEVTSNDHQAELEVRHEGKAEFRYGVHGRAHHGMSFAFPVVAEDTTPWVYSAAVIVDGDPRSDHPLDTFTVETTIEDFLSEYATWKGW